MKPPIKGRLFPLMVAGVLALAGAPAWGQAANADLAVSVTNSVSILSLGQYCTVAISVANAGPASAEGVTVTNRLPAGAALVSASASQGSWTQTAGRVTCSLGSLSPGATAWLLVELRATAVGVLTNSASVSSITPDPVGTNNSASALLPVTAARFFGVGPMLAQRYTHTATLLTNGQVLVAGGWDSNKTERYLPATRTFVPAADLTTPRSKHAAVSLPDGRVLITGGSSAEFYNPATDTFRLAAGSLAMSRYDHSMALLSSGNVLLSGGGIPSAQSELFNPAAESSAFVGGMVLGFHYSTSTVLADGKVLVTGGYGPGSAAIYNPATANFSSTGEVLWWRGTANLLPNGKVLLLGYDYNLGPAADLYDPAAGTFTPTGPPIEARVYHTATSLPDGKSPGRRRVCL